METECEIVNNRICEKNREGVKMAQQDFTKGSILKQLLIFSTPINAH